MMSSSDLGHKLQNIPRVYIGVITVLILIIPMIRPLNIPVAVTQETQDFYQYVLDLPEGAVVCFGFDCGVWHWVRTGSGAIAALNLLLTQPVKVIIWSTQAEATGLWPILESKLIIPEGVEYGVDWVYFGFVAGQESGLAQLAADLKSPGTDFYGTPLDELPIMEGVNDHNDVSLVIQNGASGAWPKFYVRQWSVPFKTPLALIQTPVNTLMNLPFRAADQINWVIWANVGGAELESILGYKGWGTANTDAQNLIHVFTMLLVIMGNIGFHMSRRNKEGKT